MKKIRIGYQGQIGAFSDRAASIIFPGADKIGLRTFSDVFKAVVSMELDAAVIPIENTSIGTITQSYDLLDEYDISIFAEYYMQIEHHLIGFSDTDLSEVKFVYSHPAALNQCQKYLSTYPNWQLISFTDTAAAVEFVSKDTEKNSVAIAADITAEIHDLKILKNKINDYNHNETRFIAISKKTNKFDFKLGNPEKMSLVIRLDHHAGALNSCLSVMSILGINLTNLIARPDKINPWSYIFFMDLMLNKNDHRYNLMLENLGYLNIKVKTLGDYCSLNKQEVQ